MTQFLRGSLIFIFLGGSGTPTRSPLIVHLKADLTGLTFMKNEQWCIVAARCSLLSFCGNGGPTKEPIGVLASIINLHVVAAHLSGPRLRPSAHEFQTGPSRLWSAPR